MILNAQSFLYALDSYYAGSTDINAVLHQLLPLAEAVASSFSDDANFRYDLIQECMGKALVSIHKYDPTRAGPYNYFASVFRNACITAMDKYSKGCLDDDLDILFINVDTTRITTDIYDDDTQDLLRQLITHMRVRFPSISTDVLDNIVVDMYLYMQSGAKLLTSSLQIWGKRYSLDKTVVIAIYNAILVYLRSNYIEHSYYTLTLPDECDILADLRYILGDDQYEKLCTIFAGMKITFPK